MSSASAPFIRRSALTRAGIAATVSQLLQSSDGFVCVFLNDWVVCFVTQLRDIFDGATQRSPTGHSGLLYFPFPLGSVVNFSVFVRNGPKNRQLSPKYLQQSLIFHKRSFTSPGVLVYESHGGCAGDSANAELGSGAIAAFE